MRPGHRLVLCVPLILMVEWQEGCPAGKSPVPLIPEVLLWNGWRRRT